MARPSFPGTRRVGSGTFQRPRTFGSGSNSPAVQLGKLQQQNSMGGGNSHSFNLANLPKANSLGSRREPNNGGGSRPFSAANLPKANSLGGQREAGNVGKPHAFNLANLPKANSLGGTHGSGTGGNPHSLNLANLANANTLAGDAQKGGNGKNPAALNGNLHALAAHAKEDPKKDAKGGGGVVGAAKNVGEAQQKVNEANAKLKASEKTVADDKKLAAVAATKLKDVKSDVAAAQAKLDQDKKNNLPTAVDVAKLLSALKAQNIMTGAVSDSNKKLAADQKTEAADKTTAAADNKDLQQAKQTLSDKQQIAQEKQEINKLKAQQQNDKGSNNQSSNNGQSSNNQSSDNGGGTDSRGSDGNSGVSRSVTSVASTAAVVGGVAVSARPGVLPSDSDSPPPPPATVSPEDTNPDQAAAINPTFILVGFQKDASDDDVAAFLKAYDASIVEGPNNDGLYKVQLTSSVPSDQVQQVIDSMKSQTNVVLSAVPE